MDMAESSDEDAAASDAKRVVVAWWKDDISGLLASLAAFAPRGSVISVVCEDQPEASRPSKPLVVLADFMLPDMLMIMRRPSLDM